LPIAEHGDLVDAVGDLMLFEPEPNLLAVGAPGVVVTIECHTDVLFLVAEQAQTGLRVRRPVDDVRRLVAAIRD
jgi:hypothetical protein